MLFKTSTSSKRNYREKLIGYSARNLGILLFLLFVSGCATRGRPIVSQFPEYGRDFKKEEYVIFEDSENLVFYSNKLSEHRPTPDHFDESKYEKLIKPDGAIVYVPIKESRIDFESDEKKWIQKPRGGLSLVIDYSENKNLPKN